ncbi:cardiolipin synthase [Clostridium pasteurianum]|uniref:Cardiolipin synthase n=1 Tax=Clostridium pasteurianum BC1 TaxID=86416 RepID=R4JZP6_CLOPA|nr:cardiolipin synthase [Clostridium pasteurianum]AGK96307.1 phosphatidylserine/phosphatidylglycerophosphate/cardiolipin synthase [Clostridium pasteurianum BC1]
MSFSILLYVVICTYLANIFCVLITLYIERRKPMMGIVWIIIMNFLPIIGFIVYLVFGRNVHVNKKITRIKKDFEALYNKYLIREKYLINSESVIFTDKNTINYINIIKLNINANKSIYSQDNDISMFTNGADKYNALIEDIKNAKDTINILYFIIRNDNIGKKIVSLLTEKAKNGVEVRILYDQVGSILTPFKMFKELIKAGGKVCKFFPVTIGHHISLNYRNHRKIITIDGKIGYVGGMNIGDEYMGLGKRKLPWRDTHLRITGSSVYFLQEIFLTDWYYASKEKETHERLFIERLFPDIKPQGSIGIQVVSSGPDSNKEQIKRSFIKMISSAKKKIYIQTPYFIPDGPFLEALQTAAMCNIDVRIMLPKIPDKQFVYKATTSYINDLLEYGIKVYLYPGFLHAKMILIDDNVCSLGTSNIDIRSFALDFEVNVFVYNTAFLSKCINIFENDMKDSEFVTKEWYYSRGIITRVLQGISRLFSPLM